MRSGNYELAKKYGKNVIDILEDKKQDKSKLKALINIGLSYYHEGRYEESMEYYIIAKEYAESFSVLIKDLAVCYSELGHISLVRKDFKQTHSNYSRALKVYKQLENKRGIAYVLNDMGNVYVKELKYSLALEAYFNSLKMKREIGDERILTTTLHNIAEVYLRLENHKESEKYMLSALEFRVKLNDKAGIISTCSLLGELYTETKQYQRAEKYLKQGLALAKEIKAKDLKREVLLNLKDYYAAVGNYKKCLLTYDEYIAVKDSIYSEVNIRHMQQLEVSYQTRETKNKLELVQLENEAKAKESMYMKIVLAVFMFSLFPIGFYFRQTQKNRILKEKVASSNRQCTQISRELHDGISGDLSQLCLSMEKENGDTTFVKQLHKIRSEIRGISHQLNISAIASQEFRAGLADSLQLDSFPDDIDLKIMVPEGFEIDEYEKKINLIRIVQELKTNSLKHANASSIVISFTKEQNKVRLDYTDNGKGVDLEKINKGNGWYNVHERVELLSGKVHIESSPGNGFYFRLTV
eukprot:TRINITY_DN561_c1_g2_i1.p1 TRINITY_DN561_c1_g2~~TRINITY_DN561_c1_g2_i1.p1  ORF type:complete len:567 (-),score=26.09 TRINITY_DN561_c1_g2_i1:2660-4234(-)